MSKGQKAEANQSPVEIDFEGDHYVIDPERMNLRVLLMVDREKYGEAMYYLLGDEQFERAASYTQSQVVDFFTQIGEALGTGNSKASPAS